MKLLCFSWLVTPAACGCRSLCVYFWAHGSWFGFIVQNNYFEYHTVLEKTARCVQSDLFQTSWTVLAWSKDCDRLCDRACYYSTDTPRGFFLMPMVLKNVLTLNKFSMKLQKNSMQDGRREMHVLVEWVGKWERTEWYMANGKVGCLKQKKSRVWSLTLGYLSQNLTLQCYWHVTEWKKV